MPQIKTCCWCFNLEVGTECVGFLHLLSGLSVLVVCIYFLVAPDDSKTEDAQMSARVLRVYVACVVSAVVNVLLAVMLLYCAFKNKVSGLRWWVYISLYLTAVGITCQVFTYLILGFPSVVECLVALVEMLLGLAFSLYCILCVHSYMLTLTGSSTAQRV